MFARVTLGCAGASHQGSRRLKLAAHSGTPRRFEHLDNVVCIAGRRPNCHSPWTALVVGDESLLTRYIGNLGMQGHRCMRAQFTSIHAWMNMICDLATATKLASRSHQARNVARWCNIRPRGGHAMWQSCRRLALSPPSIFATNMSPEWCPH